MSLPLLQNISIFILGFLVGAILVLIVNVISDYRPLPHITDPRLKEITNRINTHGKGRQLIRHLMKIWSEMSEEDKREMYDLATRL